LIIGIIGKFFMKMFYRSIDFAEILL